MLWRRAATAPGGPEYDPLPPTGIPVKAPGYKEEEIERPDRRRPKHSWLWIVITQFLGALWLAPIIYLLYLNISSYVIGPSVWCPRGHCPADPLASDAVGRAQRFDKHDHNTLGALQFVAKALELWFIFVACALLYHITMLLASSEHGLPVGLLTSPVEFADPRSLIDTIRSAAGSRHQRSVAISAGAKAKLSMFIAFVAFMCLIVNIMGPAVAVLVIPTLQWVNLPRNASHTLQAFHLGDLPMNRSDGGWIFPTCWPADISDRLYSCTADAYAASLDAWVDNAVASDSQIVDLNNNTMYNGISPEGRVFFTFNVTNNLTNQVAWVPNRQMLREISSDLDLFVDASQAANSPTKQYVSPPVPVVNDQTEASNYTYYTEKTVIDTPTKDFSAYINSLQTILKRQGPIAGALGNVYYPTNASLKTIDTNKWVQCFEGYTAYLPGLDAYNDDPSYTKCLKLGTGWDPTYEIANFTVYGSSSSALVQVYFSDKATYLAEGLDSELLDACRISSTLDGPKRCPWGTIFDDNHLNKTMDALRTNLITVEITMPYDYPGKYFVLEAVTYAYNATYTLDTSPVSNPNYMVQIDGVPDPSSIGIQPVAVDPDWLLAAWSVDYDGALYSNRSVANNLIRGLEALFRDTSFSNEDNSAYNNYTSSYSGFSETATSQEAFATDLPTSGATESNTFSNTAQSSSPTSATSNLDKRQVTTTAAATLAAASTSYTSATITSAVRPDDYENTYYNDEFYDRSSNSAAEKAPLDLQNFIYFSFLQSLSMVSFDKANFTTPHKDPKDPAHPTLHYWAMVHVWAYGLDSRTSKFGVAVASLGGLIVLASTLLGLLVRRRQRSLTELIVAAIEHQHRGELDHANGDGEIAAKFRYKIHEDRTDGRVRFVPI
ncbi:MAG: hypothetical protein HETSPECPRED_001178 [Heterodermia speciosa]|uniref:Uncharacterized protein n=1 Tax=Heterodermia speciosa TaxID=116794 RepID=A0A8H3J129_9LECA|nr:MAG: hypothetical protein HETSPECPRED_001178 [Heterodermia speciosa]